MDKYDVFAIIVMTIIGITLIMLACASEDGNAKECIQNTSIQTVEYEGHDYILFIDRTNLGAAVHSESCHCKK